MATAILIILLSAGIVWPQHGKSGPQPNGIGTSGGPFVISSVDPTLIHWWELEDDYTDSVGSVTLSPQAGTPSFVTGVHGKGVNITQTPSAGNLLATVSNAVLTGGGDFTACGWMKQNGATAPNASVLYGVDSSPFSNSWFLDTSATQTESEFIVYQTATADLSATDVHLNNTDQWAFFCGTYAAPSTLYLYYAVAGNALNQTAGVAEGGYTGPRRSDSDSLRSGYFTVGNVTLDDLRIYNRALTQAEVTTLYDAGVAALGL